MGLSQQKQLLTLWQGFMHCMESLPYFYENAWYLWYGSQTTCVLPTRLSNVYEHAIRAKLANAQTSARWRIRSQVSLRKTCKASAYPYHRHPRFFHKSSVCDSVSNA